MKPVIILGAGGHAKVLLDILKLRSTSIIGLTDADPQKRGQKVLGYEIIGSDQTLADYPPSEVTLVNGLGSTGLPGRRKHLFEKYKELGYNFATVIHPTAFLGSEVHLDEGVQIMAGTIIQTSSQIGMNTIINTKASLDHDCQIGAHVHLAPGVTLSGGVKVGQGSHIGTGANLIQNLQIGPESLIGAGSLVLKDLPAQSKVAGVPAKELL